MAGMPGRSRSKRPTISAAKCWLSAAEPPLPQAMALRPDFSAAASACPARAMSAGGDSALFWRSWMPSWKCCLRCAVRSMAGSLTCVEGAAHPFGLAAIVNRNDVEAAEGLAAQLHKEVLRGDHEPLALGRRDAR